VNRIALYTTIYPGAARFYADWLSSVHRQNKRGFDVWIGVDGIEMGPQLVVRDAAVRLVTASEGDTPASLRCRAMVMMAAQYDAIVFTDCDDVLEPTRFSAALHGLENADVHGCALQLIDESGSDLGRYFGLDEGEDPNAILPRNNFLGLSNSAWRTDSLRKCLPAPSDSIALDWLLATRAWGHEARITFDRTIRMRYRQYGENIARILPPFTINQVMRATEVVLAHYRTAVIDALEFPDHRRTLLLEAADRVERFSGAISKSQSVLDTYTEALNQLPPHRLWWLSVAHPALEDIWSS
jgi:hypothetical protein